jgi:serine/threonine-protein kinase
MTIPERIGKYAIERMIGRGGMSVVYEGIDPEIKRAVALKVVEKMQLEERERNIILTRFKYEAQAAGRLIHPNIVTIFEYGEEERGAYIAMELVRGDSVHELLLREPQPALERVRTVILPLLDALEYSHDNGVIHRDIKPSNILIGENQRIKVTDFGIARIESSALTQYGLVVGTPFYMSPEQCMGEDTDTRTDIYSAGVIAYELLTGRRPFPGKGSNASVMREVLDHVAPNPSEFNAQLTGQMDYVIQKALAKKPEDRYQTAREFAEDFRLAIEDALGPGTRVTSAPTTIETPMPSPVAADMLSMARRLRLPNVEGHDPQAPAPQSGRAPGNAPAVRIPIAPPDEASASETAESPKARILFVDDE